jgi:hypothetical protein
MRCATPTGLQDAQRFLVDREWRAACRTCGRRSSEARQAIGREQVGEGGAYRAEANDDVLHQSFGRKPLLCTIGLDFASSRCIDAVTVAAFWYSGTTPKRTSEVTVSASAAMRPAIRN